MAKPKCYYFLLFFIISCSAEKINLSPTGDTLLGNNSAYVPLEGQKNLVLYSSEITNLISSKKAKQKKKTTKKHNQY